MLRQAKAPPKLLRAEGQSRNPRAAFTVHVPRPPTRVLLLTNMVGAGDVDEAPCCLQPEAEVLRCAL